MPVSTTPAVERIARVLAGARLSANMEGESASAVPEVDAAWSEHVDEAVAVLRTLREPDARMAAAGDAQIWEAMVEAALTDAG